MNDKDLKDLENPENWDWENAEAEVGKKNRRTIVSVAFPREDFKNVAKCALQLHVSVSAFVRHAAVDTAERISRETHQSKLIPPEPGTYAMPSPITQLKWMTSETGGEIKAHQEAAATDARPPRVLTLTSNY